MCRPPRALSRRARFAFILTGGKWCLPPTRHRRGRSGRSKTFCRRRKPDGSPTRPRRADTNKKETEMKRSWRYVCLGGCVLLFSVGAVQAQSVYRIGVEMDASTSADDDLLTAAAYAAQPGAASQSVR